MHHIHLQPAEERVNNSYRAQLVLRAASAKRNSISKSVLPGR